MADYRMMTRAEHLEWAKQRAIELCDTGDWMGAYTSFLSDMNKHDETKNHVALSLMTQMLFAGHLGSADKMREFIEGFN